MAVSIDPYYFHSCSLCDIKSSLSKHIDLLSSLFICLILQQANCTDQAVIAFFLVVSKGGYFFHLVSTP